jgi:hypothetical protein
METPPHPRALARKCAAERATSPRTRGEVKENQNGFVTMPPSARNAAPLVALEAFEQR